MTLGQKFTFSFFYPQKLTVFFFLYIRNCSVTCILFVLQFIPNLDVISMHPMHDDASQLHKNDSNTLFFPQKCVSTSFLSKLFINPFEPDSCKFVSLYTLLTDLCPALFIFSDGFLFFCFLVQLMNWVLVLLLCSFNF